MGKINYLNVPRKKYGRASLLCSLSTHPSVSDRVRMQMREEGRGMAFISVGDLAPLPRAPGPTSASDQGARVLPPPLKAPRI